MNGWQASQFRRLKRRSILNVPCSVNEFECKYTFHAIPRYDQNFLNMDKFAACVFDYAADLALHVLSCPLSRDALPFY